MPKISDLPTDTAPASTDLIPFVDVDAARTESVTVANLAASAAFSGQYAPLAVDQFVDPFPAWFGGGTVDESIADIVTHMDAYVGTGTGSPEGVVTGNVGDRYIDTAATLGARVWYKASGAATNTGWLVAEGDTGWRNVSSLLVNGWTGTVLLRRFNAVVEMTIASLNSGAASSDVFLSSNILASYLWKTASSTMALPWAVSSGALQWVTITEAAGSPSTFSIPRSAFATLLGSASGSRHAVTWTTETAWPSSLPGSAA